MSRTPRSDRRAAFTLIELLVTIAIVALIMTALLGTLHTTVLAHDEAEIEMASVRDGPRILDMVERDLHALHVFNVRDGAVLRGQSERPGGLRGDRIDFVCCNDSARRLADSAPGDHEFADVASDLNEVGYRLRSSALSGDFIELWRREDLFVDEDPFEGGTYERIHERIRHLEITYLDHLGDKSEESDEWDMGEKARLPGAIRIDLELQASPELVGGFVETEENAARIYRYTRVIAIPSDWNESLTVRPYLPIQIIGRGDEVGADSGGRGGGKGPEGSEGLGGGGLNPAGGSGSLSDMMENGGPTSSRSEFTVFGDGDTPSIDINPGSDGSLSESDQAKVEQYMNEYRDRFGGSGTGGFNNNGGGGGGQ
jgi:prepilin-type N-terminal cleavage/methylation domain-containing protein